MEEKPCMTPFDDIRHHLAPPEPQSSGVRLVLSAATKLARHYRNEFQDRTQDLEAECNQRYRTAVIGVADELYSRIPEDKRE